MNKKKKESQNAKDAEKLITELYQGDKNAKLEKPARFPFVRVILLTFVFGFLGGVAGEMVMNEYFPRENVVLDQYASIFSKKKDSDAAEDQMLEKMKIEKLVSEMRAGFIEIHKKKAGGSVLEKVYFPQDRIAQGIVLTSDGWVMTGATALGKNKKDTLVLSFGQDIYNIEEMIADPLSGSVFFKVNASDLPVSKFAEYEDIKEGDEILVFDNKDSVAFTSIKSVNFIDPEKGGVWSSEAHAKMILLRDSLSGVSSGAPAVNLEGEIVGMAKGEKNGDLVLPMDYLNGSIKSILKGEGVLRSYLGVNYIDLAYVSGYGKEKKGALLYGDGKKIFGVKKGSPAEKAGLKEGDIVTKVNSEDVDWKNSLTRLIQEYPAGTSVEIVFIRDGVEYKVTVELGKYEEEKKSAEIEEAEVEA